jgi:hypothetical protein
MGMDEGDGYILHEALGRPSDLIPFVRTRTVEILVDEWTYSRTETHPDHV